MLNCYTLFTYFTLLTARSYGSLIIIFRQQKVYKTLTGSTQQRQLDIDWEILPRISRNNVDSFELFTYRTQRNKRRSTGDRRRKELRPRQRSTLNEIQWPTHSIVSLRECEEFYSDLMDVSDGRQLSQS